MAAFLFLRITLLLGFENASIKVNKTIYKTNDRVPPEVLSSKNFMFAFKLTNILDSTTINDPYYGSFQLSQI